MKGFLLILGVCFALLAVFALPTTAQAGTMNYDYATTTLDQLDAVAIQTDDSGGSLLGESAVAATAIKQTEEVVCRPLRALIRGVGNGIRGVGRGLGVGRARGNSC